MIVEGLIDMGNLDRLKDMGFEVSRTDDDMLVLTHACGEVGGDTWFERAENELDMDIWRCMMSIEYTDDSVSAMFYPEDIDW